MDKKDEKQIKRWYAMSNDAICQKLNVNPKVGLSTEEAEKRLKEDGLNKLEESKETNSFLVFLKTFSDPLALIMLIAGFLSIALPLSLQSRIGALEIPGIVVIFGVVLLNSFIATWQELNARKSLNALKMLTESKVVVLRDGEKKEIDVETLVRGDIVYLDTGKFIPADIRIIEAPQLKVDESALTGESLPVEKTNKIIDTQDPMLGDQINIGFMSTYVTNGRAIGVSVATGPYSAVGKIAKSISQTESKKTPLQKKLTQLTFWISIIATIMSVSVFLIQYFVADGDPDLKSRLISALIFSISTGIALIPESLMIVVTVSLSISAKKLVNRNVIVKNFIAIETLGSVEVICSDKTGTLTQNRMTIEKLFINNKIVDVNSYKYDKNSKQSWNFVNGMALCSDAISQGHNRIGDPTEIALTDWAQKYKIKEVKLRETYPRIDEIPFDSERKTMTTVNVVNKKNRVFCKGAVDKILSQCTHYYLDNEVLPLTEAIKEELLNNTTPLLEDALRVLGIATKDLPLGELQNEIELENNLIFIGAVAMMDPPRKEAKKAIERAHDSGIRVIMITGDHKITALAIGKRLGIVDNQFNNSLTGTEIGELSDEELREKLKNVNVFARVNPDHKTRIVEVLESEGKIVSMTGDGVNDAPSLTKADVGIAMGITGTDVAKEASNAILTDDNFSTIISGVREGRNVYEKIKIAIAFLLGANFAQMFTILFILIFAAIVNKTDNGKIVALGSINVLWHILIVETLLAIPIALRHSREQVMSYNPPSHRESIFRWIFLEILSITIFNTIMAITAFLITYYPVGSKINHLFDTSKDGYNERIQLSSLSAYIVVIFAPIFYTPIVTTRNYTVFVPYSNREKGRLNEWTIFSMLLATILNILTIFIPKINTFFGVPENNKIKLTMILIIFAYSIALSILCFLGILVEKKIFEILYHRVHKNDIRISNFNFAKKQKRDRIKQIREIAHQKIKRIREE